MDCTGDPLPSDARSGQQEDCVEHNQEATNNHNLFDGVSDNEMTRLFNSIMESEIPAELRDRNLTDAEMAEAESPSHLTEDPPYGFRFPEEAAMRARGIYETMFDTLPEMDIIVENECT